MIMVLVSVVLILAYLAVLAFYRYGWGRSAVTHLPVAAQPLPLVTVVVPARNEAANIAACLQSLLVQTYGANGMEILVVDDESTDDTAAVVTAFAQKNTCIRLLQPVFDAHTTAHKKRAIQAAIAEARGTLIACTDADCTHHPAWLASLVAASKGGAMAFVAAPVVYHTQPTLLSVFQTLDFMTLQGITAASVATRFHTMCNGANIAYSRQAFGEVGGFEGIDALPTGDDMLLMYKIYRKYPDGVCYLRHRQAMVTTQAAPSWAAFLQQRIRWASKAAYYHDRRIFYVLLLVYLLNSWILALACMAPFINRACTWLGILLLLKTIFELWFLVPVAQFFGKTRYLVWFPLMQPLHVLYTVAAGWLGRFGSYNWKGRVIHAPAATPPKVSG